MEISSNASYLVRISLKIASRVKSILFDFKYVKIEKKAFFHDNVTGIMGKEEYLWGFSV